MTYNYTLSQNGFYVVRNDGAIIPNDLGNADWQEYLIWLAVGNVPAAAPPLIVQTTKPVVEPS